MCSKAQAAAYKKEQAAQEKKEKCYECMSSCPHMTRDFKPCDGGCPDVCDKEGMRWAFLRANEKAQKCQDAGAPSGDGNEGVR